MTLRKIFQVSVPVLAAVALLGACSAGTSKVTTKAPAKIRVGAQGAANGEKMAAASAPGMASDGVSDMRMRPVKYVAGAGLVEPLGPLTAWYFPANAGPVTDAQRAALAKAFGLSGSWTTLPKDQGGYDILGDSSKGEASLTITNDALRSWWFSPSWSNNVAPVSCVEPGIAVGEPAPDAVADPPSVDAPGDIATTAVTRDPKPCDVPQPPKNVPTKAEAESKAKALLATLGLEAADYEFEAYGDEWGAWVTAWLLVDGSKTQMSMGVGYGAEGALTGASGFLAEPVRGDQYELVGIPKAVERMNDTGGYWSGYFGGGPVASSARGAVADAVAVAPAESGASTGSASGSVEGSETVVSDPGLAPEPVPTDTMPVDPLPVDTTPAAPEVPVEVLTITLTTVTVGLTQLWDADGNVWLLPSYLFTSDDGGQYSVYAVADEYLDFAAVDVPVEEVVPAVEPATTLNEEEPTATISAPVSTEGTKDN